MFSRSCTRDTHRVGRLGRKVINIHIFDGSARTGRWGASPELTIVQSPLQSRTFSAPGLTASWLLDGVWTWAHASSTPEELSTSSRYGRSRDVIGEGHPVDKLQSLGCRDATSERTRLRLGWTRRNSASTRRQLLTWTWTRRNSALTQRQLEYLNWYSAVGRWSTPMESYDLDSQSAKELWPELGRQLTYLDWNSAELSLDSTREATDGT
jgi:hypothetical protein